MVRPKMGREYGAVHVMGEHLAFMPSHCIHAA